MSCLIFESLRFLGAITVLVILFGVIVTIFVGASLVTLSTSLLLASRLVELSLGINLAELLGAPLLEDKPIVLLAVLLTTLLVPLSSWDGRFGGSYSGLDRECATTIYRFRPIINELIVRFLIIEHLLLANL